MPTTYERPMTHNVCGMRSAMTSTTGLRVAYDITRVRESESPISTSKARSIRFSGSFTKNCSIHFA